MGPPNGELMLMLNLALNEFMLNIQIQHLVMTQMQASANIVLIGICQLYELSLAQSATACSDEW